MMNTENKEEMFTVQCDEFFEYSKKFQIKKSDIVNFSNVIKKQVEKDPNTTSLLISGNMISSHILELLVKYITDVRKGQPISIGWSDLHFLPEEQQRQINQEIREMHDKKQLTPYICFSPDMHNNLPDLPNDAEFIESLNDYELKSLFRIALLLEVFPLMHLCGMKMASIINNNDISFVETYYEHFRKYFIELDDLPAKREEIFRFN